MFTVSDSLSVNSVSCFASTGENSKLAVAVGSNQISTITVLAVGSNQISTITVLPNLHRRVHV